MSYSANADNHSTISYHIAGPQAGTVKFWPGADGSYNPDGYVSVAMDGGPSDLTLFFHTAEDARVWAEAFTAAASLLTDRPAGSEVVSVPVPAIPTDTRCSTCHRSAHWGPAAPGAHGHTYTAPVAS